MNLNEPMFTTELNITSVVVRDAGSTICAEGRAGKYGQVFATWELESSGDRSGGTYYGSARAITDDEEMISGSFRGIWRRNGANLTIFSLDNASNGDQNFVQIDVDVLKKQAVAKVFSLNP